MIDRLRNLASPRRAGSLLLAASVLALAAAAPASAKLTGDFTVFAQCPTANPDLSLCIYAPTTSGELVIGKTTIPINHTIVLQGGSIQDQSGQEKFFSAANGETLSRTALAVPGGLSAVVEPEKWPGALQKSYEEDLEDGLTAVTATAELVGEPGISIDNLIFESNEVALSLPVRIKLESAFLGSGCYIGSKTSPITLDLTTGTTSPPAPNTSRSGSIGQIQLTNAGELILVEEVELLDNAFSVPVATGCGGFYTSVVDPSVDAKLGLPSAAGHNTAVLDGTQEYSEADYIRSQMK
jgi:hypothetical protein